MNSTCTSACRSLSAAWLGSRLRPVLYNYLDRDLTVRPLEAERTVVGGLGQVKGGEPSWAGTLASPSSHLAPR